MTNTNDYNTKNSIFKQTEVEENGDPTFIPEPYPCPERGYIHIGEICRDPYAPSRPQTCPKKKNLKRPWTIPYLAYLSSARDVLHGSDYRRSLAAASAVRPEKRGTKRKKKKSDRDKGKIRGLLK